MHAVALQPDLVWDTEVRRHNRKVVTVLLARGVRLPDAKDLAQEAWARLFEKWRSGQLERLELPGLVIRQALFLAADRRRADKRADLVTLQAAAPSLAGGNGPCSTSPESRLLAAEELVRARQAFASCSPRAREVFARAYSDNVPHAQLAESLGISVQRLRQTLCEVRAKLRAAMEEADE